MSNSSAEVGPFDVLLIEDREADFELIRLGLAMCRMATKLHSARDGRAALAMLRREGEFNQAPRPHLVLLDLNLPLVHGHEVLAKIKNDPQLGSIPVVVLTTSMDEHDVKKAYAGHANAYMVKPLLFDELIEVLRDVTEYWLRAVALPPRH